jgi:16S rRNA (cytosine1407-C5)-methyltransferase
MRTLPAEFLDRLGRLVPASHHDAVVRSFGRRKPVSFRVNTLKAAVRDVLESLKQAGFKAGNVPWMKEAFLLQNRSQRDLESTPEYEQGLLYLQNLSSMVPPLVLAPQPGERVLDLAAAPGSKTTQMAAMMGNEGSITAVDENAVRVERLKANLARQGVICAEAITADGAMVGGDRPEGFDRVLLDAPCTAEGRFLAGEPRTYSYWRVEKVRKTARLQKRLMRSALQALRVGGMMVYSTCTFSPEENEGVLAWALERFPDQVECLPVKVPLPNALPGVATWEGRAFPAGTTNGMRILPTDSMEGFFVAKLIKRASLPRGVPRPG